MKIKIVKSGVKSAVRSVPTDTTLIVLPMTPERIGKNVDQEEEDALRVDSVDDAFGKFKPSLNFVTQAGEEQTEFVMELDFKSLKDFTPENIQKKVAGKRNDIADLKSTIDLLYRLKDRWMLPSVRRAWGDPNQRKQILAALSKLRQELEKVTQSAHGGQ